MNRDDLLIWSTVPMIFGMVVLVCTSLICSFHGKDKDRTTVPKLIFYIGFSVFGYALVWPLSEPTLTRFGWSILIAVFVYGVYWLAEKYSPSPTDAMTSKWSLICFIAVILIAACGGHLDDNGFIFTGGLMGSAIWCLVKLKKLVKEGV